MRAVIYPPFCFIANATVVLALIAYNFLKRLYFLTCLCFSEGKDTLLDGFKVAFGLVVDASRSDISRLPIPMNPFSKLSPARWATNIIRDKISTTSVLEESEPGFDYNEEEMRKLKIWPGGIIPYYIDEFSFDKVFRDRIRTFLDVTNSITGLNFLELHSPPEDQETRWVFFVNRQGLLHCADHPFKNFTYGGVQKVILGYDCLTTGGELAEVVLAIVGVPPQHNAPDRDEYVSVEKKNIMPGKAYLFEVMSDDEWLFHGMNYDFTSASHYPFHKYTVNGLATIKPKGAILYATGEGKGFSYMDIWKIRMLYNYISKKRLKSVNLPKCEKLFNVSTNFSQYEPESEDDVQPRKKPNKYLGLPDENPSANNKTEESSGEETHKQENDLDNIPDEKSANNDQSENSKEINEDKNSKENNSKLSLKLKKKDLSAMSHLSDYNTDDEKSTYNSQKRGFTKPGG